MPWEWIKHKRALDRLDRWERDIEKRRDRAREEAKKKGKPFGYEDEHMVVQDLFEVDAERQGVVTRWLMKQAWHYDVPRPSHDDTGWEEAAERRYLNTEARAELRSLIRKERLERAEFVLRVLAIAVPLVIGTIGAITGLVAVWYK